MSGKVRNKMTKDTVPEGFGVALALTDLIPVVFFGLSAVRVGDLFDSALFTLGAAASGLLLFDDLASDLVVRVDLGEICRAGDFLSCRVNERNHAFGKIEFPQFHVGVHCIKSGGCCARGESVMAVTRRFGRGVV